MTATANWFYLPVTVGSEGGHSGGGQTLQLDREELQKLQGQSSDGKRLGLTRPFDDAALPAIWY